LHIFFNTTYIHFFHCHACVVLMIKNNTFSYEKPSVTFLMYASYQACNIIGIRNRPAIVVQLSSNERIEQVLFLRREQSRLTRWQFTVIKQRREGTREYRFGYKCQSHGKPREAPPQVLCRARAIRSSALEKPEAKLPCLFRLDCLFLWKANKSPNKQALSPTCSVGSAFQ
jgi:hypothetical protein